MSCKCWTGFLSSQPATLNHHQDGKQLGKLVTPSAFVYYSTLYGNNLSASLLRSIIKAVFNPINSLTPANRVGQLLGGLFLCPLRLDGSGVKLLPPSAGPPTETFNEEKSIVSWRHNYKRHLMQPFEMQCVGGRFTQIGDCPCCYESY